MVTFKGHSRFYSRNSAGKYQLDVGEIRSAFLATESQADRIRRFMEERIGRIFADEAPIALSGPGRLIMHLIPIPSFLNCDRFPLESPHNLRLHFSPPSLGGYGNRFNIDGFLSYSKGNAGSPGVDEYYQLFFDGTVEWVNADLIWIDNEAKSKWLRSTLIHRDIVRALRSFFEGYQSLAVEGPFVLSIAILGCVGSFLPVDSALARMGQHPIDRHVIVFPDVVVEDLDVKIETAVQPLLDALWNACGFARCLDYDEQGNLKE